MPRRRFKLDQPSIFSNFCILGFKLPQNQPYEELFKPPLDMMYKGDWQSVRDSASAAKKWLIVNIQVTGIFVKGIFGQKYMLKDILLT